MTQPRRYITHESCEATKTRPQKLAVVAANAHVMEDNGKTLRIMTDRRGVSVLASIFAFRTTFKTSRDAFGNREAVLTLKRENVLVVGAPDLSWRGCA